MTHDIQKQNYSEPTDAITVEPNSVEIREEAIPTAGREPTDANMGYAHMQTGAPTPELPDAIDRLNKGKAHFWMGLSALVLFSVTVYNVQEAIASVKLYKTDLASLVESAKADTFEGSLAQMNKALDEQHALLEVKRRLEEIKSSGRGMNENEARELLMRAGYDPDELLNAKAKKQAEAEDLISQDIRFAKDIANDVVREEIKNYVDKVNILTRVGQYVVNRNK